MCRHVSIWGFQNSVCLSVPREKKSPWLRQYQSYISNYASPSSGEAYRDRQLTTNIEFWDEIFCVPTCFHIWIPKPCLSVRTPRKDDASSSLRGSTSTLFFVGYRVHGAGLQKIFFFSVYSRHSKYLWIVVVLMMISSSFWILDLISVV